MVQRTLDHAAGIPVAGQVGQGTDGLVDDVMAEGFRPVGQQMLNDKTNVQSHEMIER